MDQLARPVRSVSVFIRVHPWFVTDTDDAPFGRIIRDSTGTLIRATMITAERIFLKPRTAAEAVAMACEHADDFRFLAGGTDVLVNSFQGTDGTTCLVDLTGIAALKEVTTKGDHLRIGPMVRLSALEEHAVIRESFPSLIEAAHAVASPIIRRSATLGGNLLCENRCSFYNQSEWWRDAVGNCLKCDGDVCIATGGRKACFSKLASDTAPVLIAMEAQLEVVTAEGTQIIPLESIYTGDGVDPRNLPPTALIQAILLPLGRGFRVAFRKLRPREAVDFSSLTTALAMDAAGKVRIVLGAVDPKPIIVDAQRSDDQAALITKAVKKARIIDNDPYPRLYRKEMITVFLERSFEELDKN